MYERMTTEHGYSLRKLAQKLGKDKGYIENRLRLADAPSEIKQLVSLRKDTLSHAYELLKVDDPRKRRKLAEQVARGRAEPGQAARAHRGQARPRACRGRPPSPRTSRILVEEPPAPEAAAERPVRRRDDLQSAKERLAEALDELSAALRAQDALRGASDNDRQNFAKYLTIAKLKLENAIAVVRAGEPRQNVSPAARPLTPHLDVRPPRTRPMRPQGARSPSPGPPSPRSAGLVVGSSRGRIP